MGVGSPADSGQPQMRLLPPGADSSSAVVASCAMHKYGAQEWCCVWAAPISGQLDQSSPRQQPAPSVPVGALTHLLEASHEVPQVAGGVADDGGEAPAMCPLLLPPKHGQLCLRKVPEVGHHILPYGIRGRSLQAAVQSVKQVLLLVATRGNQACQAVESSGTVCEAQLWLLGQVCH